MQISLEDARKKWPEFIQVLEKDSPALTFILKLAELHEVNGNTFVIAVGHQFHRDKLNEKHCMQKIESMLAPIYGGNINLNIVLKDKKAIVEKKQELDSLASAFGGEVVA
ncbi:MAG: hypothetical protein COU33_04610 [Candidatus Magasanikbacteria bacterium CG10_big_fil_rev_8_21_14_0_10_43_6]|uniref:DNA polymerase III PolC-like N-terminal domain-containing protein n=1 Tax=Candidatus Magasanikbacteria bacterium CG10_big_fil_rev_8_21_14_0_10_43_6 TaxID=1974650 RepID=A0A2M6W047_9BACT|nr:MAG: hypothetical protein COU33_04610 [Candidatus Magasanikbacteria bacterium CG10_big_fil_rev_8_21_14_0_10_43_6]